MFTACNFVPLNGRIFHRAHDLGDPRSSDSLSKAKDGVGRVVLDLVHQVQVIAADLVFRVWGLGFRV